MDDIEIEMHEKFKGIIKIEDFEFDVGYATKFYGCQKYKIIHPLCINTRKFIEHGILDKHTPTINELYEYNRLNSVKLNEYCQYYIKKYKEYFNNL